MRLALMQPYFFPYLGYFSLIQAVDRWIAYDTPQYPREGWVHRNRVLSKGLGGWKYVRVPTIKVPLGTSIRDVLVDHRGSWIDELLRNLDYYRECKAPHYKEVTEFLTEACSRKTECLSTLLFETLKATCRYVGVSTRLDVFSELNWDVMPANTTAQEKVRSIVQSLEATTYVNLPGGRTLYSRDAFEAYGIDLLFINPTLPSYNQGRPGFSPGLSIIDALMWKCPSDVRSMICEYELTP